MPITRMRAIRLVSIAAIAGILAGTAAVYLNGSGSGNVAGGECGPALETAAAVKPLATGEVAAFVVADAPLDLSGLAFKDDGGADMTLKDFAGKTLFVNLWATWCVPCRKEMPAIASLQDQLGGDAFDVMAINIDTRDPQKPKDFLASIEVDNLTYYADSTTKIFLDLKKAGKAFGMPSTVIVDPAGCLVGHMAGPAEWASDDALALVRGTIAGGSG